jgi:microcystin-dependent protein
MALRQRNFFFDPTNTDRFNSQDIPTEQTMSDWCDSVPFIKEPTDRAQQTRAGIAKTTSDAKINAGDNTDASGVSPLGFTTFVRPAQIPKILDSPSVTWAKVPRGGATSTDTGVGIEDWQATVNFPVDPVETTATVLLHQDFETKSLQGVYPCSVSELIINTPQNNPLVTQLVTLKGAIDSANALILQLCDSMCELQSNQVTLGDVVMTVTPPSYWGSNWAEPIGQSLLIADHPQLYALFLNTYGVAAPGYFKIPDLVQQQNYIRVQQSGGGLLTTLTGGQATRTLVEDDLPQHSHTVTGTATGGEHSHAIPIYTADTGVDVIDGNGGDDVTPPPDVYNLPTGGGHTHPVTGTTNPYGEINPDPVWNVATNVTPRYTNFFLKMRVK